MSLKPYFSMAEHWTAVLLTLLSVTRAGVCETLPGSCRIVCDPSSGLSKDQGNGFVIPLTSSAAGPPGPRGPPGKAGPAGPAGPSGIGSSSTGGVAFSAALQDAIAKNDVIKFNDVITNLGGGYDSSTGTFTCKTAGVYYFIFSIVKTGQNLRVDLFLNDQTAVASAVAVDVLHTDTASNSVVLQLKAGDRLYVRLNSSELSKRDSQSRFSIFSGYLLYEI
ncbi:complement C1q-like protein 4 [Puntigrus tetrazona]|uniref:complement C1q-like protein 4 n=1 Tax=Puntigrus tetrazona TaxID=1606681 RepID=UPI001C8A08A7|nr:complement C1q-like protein 4 [Puntigrus tetrazona]